MFLQQLITGLSVGSIYALMAVGYSLIYSLLNFTNFAHGASVLIGAYVGYFYISSVADNVLMAVVCSTFFGAVLAALIERIAYQPLLNKGVKRIYLLIAGLGISIIGENLIVVMIDGRFHAYKTSLSAMPVSILGASIGVVDLIILVASAIALLSVQFLIRKTRVGLAIRGAAFDLTTASIMGINVRQLILIVFIIAGSMAGLSGVFLGIKYTAYPTMGNLTNKAFISAVVGGLGSMPGAVVGALILGVLETMISAYVSSALRNLFAYALLIVILLIKPTGLMGKSMEEAKLAVKTGYWPLYRFNPTLTEEGKNPFTLDSKAPDGGLNDFLLGENRYAQLQQAHPEIAGELRATMARQYEARYEELTSLAARQPETAK